MKNLRNRNFLTLLDFTTQEVEFLLNLSEDLKRAKYAGIEQQRLVGKILPSFLKKIPHVPVVLLRLLLMIRELVLLT